MSQPTRTPRGPATTSRRASSNRKWAGQVFRPRNCRWKTSRLPPRRHRRPRRSLVLVVSRSTRSRRPTWVTSPCSRRVPFRRWPTDCASGSPACSVLRLSDRQSRVPPRSARPKWACWRVLPCRSAKRQVCRGWPAGFGSACRIYSARPRAASANVKKPRYRRPRQQRESRPKRHFQHRQIPPWLRPCAVPAPPLPPQKNQPRFARSLASRMRRRLPHAMC